MILNNNDVSTTGVTTHILHLKIHCYQRLPVQDKQINPDFLPRKIRHTLRLQWLFPLLGPITVKNATLWQVIFELCCDPGPVNDLASTMQCPLDPNMWCMQALYNASVLFSRYCKVMTQLLNHLLLTSVVSMCFCQGLRPTFTNDDR